MNASNKAIHTPLERIGIRKASASNNAINIPSTREDLILVRTFQNYMNMIVGEDTSLDKDSNALVRIFKPLPIVGWGAFVNVGIKRKLFVDLNNMVDTIKQGSKMLVSSINKIHTTNLEIKEQRTQISKEIF